ncbi:hypothetical protein JTB14_031023 [Gonioctena quinquepunctata]|nr:hypothetical protein JTB14_031023 [Gonioctena quinquepunctata]
MIEKTRQNPEHILFVTSDRMNNGRKVQDEVTKILDPRTQILKINRMRTTNEALIIEASSKEDLDKIMNNPAMREASNVLKTSDKNNRKRDNRGYQNTELRGHYSRRF